MRNQNPWFVPPCDRKPSAPDAKASSVLSNSIDPDDEFDPDLVEAQARLLHAKMVDVCNGEKVGTVLVASLMLMSQVLRSFSKGYRKNFIDGIVEYLMRR
jgi:hypothetical protein